MEGKVLDVQASKDCSDVLITLHAGSQTGIHRLHMLFHGNRNHLWGGKHMEATVQRKHSIRLRLPMPPFRMQRQQVAMPRPQLILAKNRPGRRVSLQVLDRCVVSDQLVHIPFT